MDLELKENDLISFMNPICPQCRSKNVVRNGTCSRTMENGTVFRMQKCTCTDCRYSFVARPPNYGYGKHFPDDIKDKGVKSRVKTSLRKAADLFRIIGNTIISHETVRRLVPPPERGMMESSGYFVYDEQYKFVIDTISNLVLNYDGIGAFVNSAKSVFDNITFNLFSAVDIGTGKNNTAIMNSHFNVYAQYRI